MTRSLLLALLLLSGCGSLGSVRSLVGLESSSPSPGLGSDAAQARTLYLDLIRGLRERGLNRAALAHLDEFERVHGRSTAADLQRGQALAELGDGPGAAAALARVTGPERAAADNSLGLVAGRARDWPRAQAHFEAAVRLEPTNVRYINNLGFAQLNRGAFADAEARLRMAHELEPENTEVRNNLAVLMLASNRPQLGEGLLAQAAGGERDAIRREGLRLRSQVRSE